MGSDSSKPKRSRENDIHNRPQNITRNHYVQQSSIETSIPIGSYPHELAPARNSYKPPVLSPTELLEFDPLGVCNQVNRTINSCKDQNKSSQIIHNVQQQQQQQHTKNEQQMNNEKSVTQTLHNTAENPILVCTREDDVKTINFDGELAGIKNAMKSKKNGNFIKFNKSLTASKSLHDARGLLVNNSYMSDVQFNHNGNIIYGHKMFLITSSSLFFKTFQIDCEKSLEIDPSVSREYLLQILKYCYTNELKVTRDNVLDILVTANVLQVRQVTNICHGFISKMIDPDSIFIIFEKAIELNSELFQKKCLEFIEKNEERCFKSNGFFKISLQSLMKILEKCKFPSEKSSDIIEKWNNGSMIVEEKTESVKKQNKPANKKNNTGAVKKNNKKNPSNSQKPSSMSNLLDIDVPQPTPDFIKPFNADKLNIITPFAESSNDCDNLINFDDDDEDLPLTSASTTENDEIANLITRDDDATKSTIMLQGARKQWKTEFSRIDFIAKCSIDLHEIYFNENLFANAKEVRIAISTLNGSNRSDIHNRLVKNDKPGMRLNFIKFTKKPLKIYAGQMWYVKIHFKESAQRIHLHANKLSSTDMLELRKDGAKTYFNCISKLVASPIT